MVYINKILWEQLVKNISGENVKCWKTLAARKFDGVS
jgi:hypothetical protein